LTDLGQLVESLTRLMMSLQGGEDLAQEAGAADGQ